MELIQTVTVGSGGASAIELTPTTGYDDIVIVTSLRIGGSGPSFAHIRINGLEANYSTRFLQGDGSSASSGSNPGGTTYTWFGTIPGTEATANTFSNAQIYFPNYRSSAAKSWSVDSVMETNGTTSYQSISAHLNTTTNPITSIVITPVSANFVQHSSASLYGIRKFNTSTQPKATGGAISYDAVNNKWVHVFTASGTFTPTQNLTGVEYLIVAGGAGGAGSVGGGGGAGGYRSSVVGESSGGGGSAESTLSLTSGVGQTVNVGAGGTGGGPNTVNSPATAGSNSVFGSITATGGGRGGQDTSVGQLAGASGGSGGGGYYAQGPGSGTANQGYAGGNGRVGGGTGDPFAAGGGGGAGSVGANGLITGSGNGGSGVTSSITGTAIARAGGGGGGADAQRLANSFGLGGSGGGGNGGTAAGSAGLTNSGGGGGAGGNVPQSSGGNGGSGIVIVRYSA